MTQTTYSPLEQFQQTGRFYTLAAAPIGPAIALVNVQYYLDFAHNLNQPHEHTLAPLPAAPEFEILQSPEAQFTLEILEGMHEADNGSVTYPISGGAMSTEDMVADISYLGRTLAQLGPDSPAYQALGLTTGWNSFMGFYSTVKAWHRFQMASRTGDTGGQVDAALNMGYGVSQGVGGGAYISFRVQSIAAQVAGVNTTMAATTPLGLSTFIVGVIGNVFFSLFYAFIGLHGAYNLHKTGSFRYELSKQNDPEAMGVVPFLLAKAHANTHEKLQTLQGLSQDRQDSYKNALKEKALNAFTDQLMQCQKRLNRTDLNCENLKLVVQTLLAAIDRDPAVKEAYIQNYLNQLGLQPHEVADLNLSAGEVVGLKMEERERASRKEAKLGRVLSGGNVVQIKDALKKGLGERLLSNDPNVKAAAEAEALVLEKVVKSQLMKNLIINSDFVFFGVLGVVVSALTIGLFALPPGWGVAITVLTVLLVFAMLGIDVYSWKAGLESSPPGKHDKLFVAIISTLLISTLLIAAGLTFGLGFPILPFALTMIIGLVALNVCVYSWIKIEKHEKKWKLEHPDLERFANALDTYAQEELDERVVRYFKKLSKEDRQKIRAKYFELSGNLPFRKEAFQQLNQHGHFGREYVNSAIYGEQVEALGGYSVLERAAKKTAKEFWGKWNHAQLEIDKQRALRMNSFIELTKLQALDALKAQLSLIREDAELYRSLKRNIWYLCKREESSSDLKTALHEVRFNAPAAVPEFDEDRFTRIQQIFVHNQNVA